MDIYLIDEAKNYKFHFPVNPLNSLSLSKEKRYISCDILDFGEVDINQKGEKIREISFNSLFPKEYDESYCREMYLDTPLNSKKLIEGWQDIEQSLRLIITNIDVNELVSISKFTYEFVAGELEDIYFNITFRTNREIKIETVNNTSVNSYSGGLQDNRNTQSATYNAGDKVKVTASALNVRNGPGTNYNILGSVSKGTSLEIYRVSGNWADVYWGNHGGYICLDYVTK
ncbi:SH3 domain-containing protein [Clostridium botulinum]|uniref:SH3 domain-containing protein n=1 Tax=Clostridium botulinum TaxID=1491 RepID=UPI0019683607|nr:SH3 domain-containing protein [Clostridium botulinum]MBN1058536.1 SH3 domain-containing protein [Clostridium botulinum]